MSRLNIKTHFLLVLTGTLISVSCFSQEDSTKDKMEYPNHMLTPAPVPFMELFYRGNLEAGGGVMYPVANKALRVSLGGVYNVHFSGDYVFAQHIYGGLELENTQFGNTENVANASTLMFVFSAGAKIGYYTFMQNDFLFCYSLSGGPSLITYNYPIIKPPKGGFKETSFFVEPDLLAAYRVNNELRIGLDLNITFLGYHFDPRLTGLDQLIDGYNPSWANFPTLYFEWGFGLYWAFAEPKNK